MQENNTLTHHHGWDFDKRISLGNVLTAIAISTPFFIYINKMDKRIGLLEQRVEIEVTQRKEAQAAQDKRALADRQEAREERKELAKKLDDHFTVLTSKIDALIKEN